MYACACYKYRVTHIHVHIDELKYSTIIVSVLYI